MRDRNRIRNASNAQGPHFSVQDEIRRDRHMRRSRSVRLARSATRRAFTAFLCLALCALLLGAIALTVMRVDTVTVSGNARYTSNEIVQSAAALGEVLLLLGDKAVYDRIAAACPYVERIELIKTYPSSVEIRVYETEAIYYTVAHGRCLSLDRELRVIDYTEDTDGLIGLVLPELKSAVEGRGVVFRDEAAKAFVLEMLDAFVNCADPIAFTSIDLRDRYDLTAAMGDNVKVLFGDYRNLDVKMPIAKTIIADAEKASSVRTLINVSEPSRAGAQHNYQGEF